MLPEGAMRGRTDPLINISFIETNVETVRSSVYDLKWNDAAIGLSDFFKREAKNGAAFKFEHRRPFERTWPPVSVTPSIVRKPKIAVRRSSRVYRLSGDIWLAAVSPTFLSFFLASSTPPHPAIWLIES